MIRYNFDGTVFIHSLDDTEIYLGPKQYPRLTSRVFLHFYVLQVCDRLPAEIF